MPSETPSEIEQLRAWVTGRARDLPPDGLSDDLPLLAGRHLTSLHIPELILLLERLRRQPIDVENLSAGDFQDVATIAARFLNPAVAPIERTSP
ncbi:hypothetical protein ABT255_32535 [Streptomyces mirabilis]|uniref:hypothetical protein n=1 Tax=Streptomyces mirabilis TaxID=68239 RepID=UPI003324E2AC